MSRIIYLHGFASGTRSRKGDYFRERLAEAGIAMETPDLAQGDFEHLTMGGQLQVIEETAAGEPVTLVGSSLGGYLAAVYAAAHPETERLVLLAPAFGFNQRWPCLFGPEAFAEWQRTGKLSVYHQGDGCRRDLGFQIYKESASWEPYPSFAQPALIYHGRLDDVVPAELSERYAATHPNVRLTLLDSDHGLVEALPQIWGTASEFLLSS